MARGGKWQYILGAVVLIPLTGFLSWEELRFMQTSSKADAQILNVTEKEGHGRRSRPKLEVEYQFTDASGKSYHDTDKVPTSWSTKIGSSATIPVQYLTASPSNSRLAGHDNMPAVFIFFAAIAASIGAVVWTLMKRKAA